MFVKTIRILTKQYVELDVITPQVEQIVAESGVKNGMVTVMTKHTTTGVTVNEALECSCCLGDSIAAEVVIDGINKRVEL